jgi:D-alanyl-D-alanine carboxypeptidase
LINHTSGLDFNRITPRTSVTVLRKMIDLLKTYRMRLEDIMPVAGVDVGTLNGRFRAPGMAGAIVAKTGTLHDTDNGVSALQGVIYSESYGPLLFGIFNMGGDVAYFRQQQDRFLNDVVDEICAQLEMVRKENILPAEPNEIITINESIEERLRHRNPATQLRAVRQIGVSYRRRS